MKETIFGARQIGGPPSYLPCDERNAQEVLEYAYSQGIQTFDTAPIYGMGQSEKILGKTFEHKQDIRIISKFGFGLAEDGRSFFDFSRDGIRNQLEASLKRLKRNSLEIYLLHIPQTDIDISDILCTLNELKKEGLIQHYGVCNTYLKQLKNFLEHPLSEIEYIADFYNILEKKAETLIFPYKTGKHKFLAYGPLYRGVMTDTPLGELLKKEEEVLHRLLRNDGLPQLLKQRRLYEEVAKKSGMSLSEIALRFLFANPQVEGIIFGTKSKKHLQTFIEIRERILSFS